MKKSLLTLLLFASATIAVAGTDIKCIDVDSDSNDDALETCLVEVNDKLNATYKQLRNRDKDWKEKQEALKNMQLGWIKMRDSQCLFQSMNSAGGAGAARIEMRCEIEMTIKREKELSEL